MKTDTPRPIHLKDYKPSDYLIETVDLNVRLDAAETQITSKLKLRPNPAAITTRAPLQLDGHSIALKSVKLDGKVLTARSYRLGDQHLVIPKVPNKAFELEIETTCNPEANKALQGLYRSRGIYCTQCEAEGFRQITYFLDRPDVLARYKVRLEADIEEASVLLSNGNPVERGTCNGGKRHYAIWSDPHPKPAYLFALVAGNLHSISSPFKTMSGRNVQLTIYVEPGKEHRCAWAMDSLKRSMRWDEKVYGREYDLDVFNIVAVSDFNMGAMENKGLNIFNDRLILASSDTATDASYEAIEAVVAHEYFHNWTGNRITCRDWFQLCLKEGLTVFRDQAFSADERSATVQRIADVRALKAHQFPEDAGPLAHPVRPAKYIEINNFYTATVYEKGAELCRMIQTIVGEEGFRKGMDLYFNRHDGEAATVEDFVAAFEDATGKDLKQFFTWYGQAGTPELICDLQYDKAQKRATLTVNQVLPPTPGQARKKPLHIPLRLGLLGGNGQDLDLRLRDGTVVDDGLLHITKREQAFVFEDIPSQPVPSLLRGFSAPVNLTIDLSDRDLEFLMANDSDQFNRWQAAQSYATRTIIQIVDALRSGKRSARGAGFARALGATLIDETLEPAYRAQILALPSEADIAREIGENVDPGAIHTARRQLLRLVARHLADDLQAIYKSQTNTGKFSPDATSAGRRALRNAALALLTRRGEKSDISRLTRHYRQSDNMTDQTVALALLANQPGPEREKALADFYKRWKDDHIVIDRWFGVQATSSLPDTPERVATLKEHELFSMTNPNKVRSLVGSFASFNMVGFNRPDGAGYKLVADTVLELDGFNPSIAARMLSAFRSWRTLEPKRRRLAKRALDRIARKKELSRDVFEIVTKTLE